MNATALSNEPAINMKLFAAATARVNEWRGRCMDAFTRTEVAITECIAMMAEQEVCGGEVRLPHLVGERFTSFAALAGPGGSFEAEGAIAAASLTAFREHDRLRTMICHGTAKVTLDSRGAWTVVFRTVVLRSRQLSKDVLVLTESEANALQRALVAASRDLCSRLGQVRTRILRP